jgi:regulator of protease activity HflC (stomatin/prohibitin superfamily)
MQWLAELWDKIISLFPRLVILEPNQAGVVLRLGKPIKKDCRMGWYILAPIIDDMDYIELPTRPLYTREQSITNLAGYSIGFSGVLEWKIKNAYLAMYNTADVEESLTGLAMGVSAKHVKDTSERNWQEIDAIQERVLSEINKGAYGWGVEIKSYRFSDYVKHRVIRIMSSQSSQQPSSEDA